MPFCSQALAVLALVTLQNDATAGTARTANEFLHWLYIAAAVLASVLFLVIVLAVFVWRKNRDTDPGSDRTR